MTDSETLFLILILIYVSDCLVWVRRDAIAFVAPWLRGWRWRQGSEVFGTRRGGLVLVNPLPPLGQVFLCQAPPLLVSPDGVCVNADESGVAESDSAPRRAVSWAEVRSVGVVDNDVRVNGEVFVRTGSATLARRAGEQLRRLAPMAASAREAAILTDLNAALDVSSIREVLTAHSKARRPVLGMCIALFTFLLVLAPLATLFVGLEVTIAGALAGLVLLVGLTAILFRRAHKKLAPEAKGERRLAVAFMILAPPAAIRATDALSRDLLRHFHPLAVARVLLGKAQFAALMQRRLLELRFPVESAGGSDEVESDVEAGATAADATGAASTIGSSIQRWYRSRLLPALESLGREAGLDLEALLRPPAPEDGCRSYCERCHAQFTFVKGTCGYCGERPVVAFDEVALRAI